MRHLRTTANASRLIQLVGCAVVASQAAAQGPTAEDVLGSATEIVATLEDPKRCDLSLHGVPALDELTSRWLIAYSGVGPACDEASTQLQREGIAASITFFRRPNLDEVKALIGTMRAQVRRGFECAIWFNGEPRFDDESNLWTVRYNTSGQQCTEAGEELERKGKEFRVAFQRLR